MTLGERITLARKKAGLSQEQLGDRLGVSRQAVSKWESNQTNPDVAYVAQMCRLLEVSSGWLLLGEENARTAAPARCPGCQSIVSGLDLFCPACGRSLRSGVELPQGYTLLLKTRQDGVFSPREDLITLSNTGIFAEDSPLCNRLTWDEAEDLANSAPVVLAKGLSEGQIQSIWKKVYNPSLFLFFQDCDEEDPQVLAAYPGLNPNALPSARAPREPLSFGGMVLACACGFIAALLFLPLLINMISFITHVV